MRRWGIVAGAATAYLLGGGPAFGDDQSIEERFRQLEQRVEAQERQLEAQERQLDDQRRASQEQREQLAERSEPSSTEPNTFRVFWKNGIRAETEDKAFQARIGGRIQTDFAFFTEDDDVKDAFGDLENGAEFRRARLFVRGVIYDRVAFKAQYDFAGGDADFKDVYIGLEEIPYAGNILVGHFKEPFTLEEFTSSKYITFLERGLPNAFAPSRNMGFMATNHLADERLNWQLGVFRDSDGFGSSSGDGSFNVTGRVSGTPYFEENGRKLAHLGMAFRYGDPDDDEVRFRQRPEAHLAPRLVDTGDIASDGVGRLGLEAATVLGPLSFQGEYVHNWVDTDAGEPEFHGHYVQASYFLTGEHRRYKSQRGVFDRVRVNRPFLFGDGGPGAWEIAARYSSIDLQDGSVAGGALQDVTGGVNWHLNDNTRVMANYVWAKVRATGNAHAFQTRFQIDF